MTAPRVRQLCIFGAGGHGREIAWLARESLPDTELTFIVDDERFAQGPVNGIPVVAITAMMPREDAGYVTAVGDIAIRRRAVARLDSLGLRAVALVHPRAEVAPTAIIEAGAVVCAGSVLTDGVAVGPHAVVNVGCTLSHDVRLGEFATVSPGVHIAGHVDIGADAFIGVGASIVNGSSGRPISIGAAAVVGAGAVVLHDVGPGTVVGGVPARPLKRGTS